MQLEGNILKPFPKVSPNFQHKIKSGRFRMKIFFWESVISGAMFEVFFLGGGTCHIASWGHLPWEPFWGDEI